MRCLSIQEIRGKAFHFFLSRCLLAGWLRPHALGLLRWRPLTCDGAGHHISGLSELVIHTIHTYIHTCLPRKGLPFLLSAQERGDQHQENHCCRIPMQSVSQSVSQPVSQSDRQSISQLLVGQFDKKSSLRRGCLHYAVASGPPSSNPSNQPTIHPSIPTPTPPTVHPAIHTTTHPSIHLLVHTLPFSRSVFVPRMETLPPLSAKDRAR